MITYVFNVGQQNRKGIVPRQVSVLVELKGELDATTASLPCPNHKLNSRATIRLSNFRYGCKWEIVESCCPEFGRAIESAASLYQDEPELSEGS